MATRLPTDRVVAQPIADVVATALGTMHREDPVAPRLGGPAGNARLTAWAGMLLLVLFLAETATLLSVRSMLTAHIVIGTVLVPLALLKTATTSWRMLRYYLGSPAYRVAGPPPLVLRVAGPLVVLGALAVLGSGLALVALGEADHRTLFTVLGSRVDAVTVHQAAFAVWLVTVGFHVLVRTVSAVRLLVGGTPPGRGGVPGGLSRLTLVSLTLAAGAVTSAVVVHLSPW